MLPVDAKCKECGFVNNIFPCMLCNPQGRPPNVSPSPSGVGVREFWARREEMFCSYDQGKRVMDAESLSTFTEFVEKSAYDALKANYNDAIAFGKTRAEFCTAYEAEIERLRAENADYKLWAKEQPDFLAQEVRLKNERDEAMVLLERMAEFDGMCEPYDSEVRAFLERAKARKLEGK